MDTRMYYLNLFHTAAAASPGMFRPHKDICTVMKEWVLFRKYWDEGDGLGKLAASIGVPREELTDFILFWTGERFMTIRKRLRIYDAREMIVRHPEMSMAKIARTVGFLDKSDFRRAFTDVTGYTPRLWRECKGKELRCRIRTFREGDGSRCHALRRTS